MSPPVETIRIPLSLFAGMVGLGIGGVVLLIRWTAHPPSPGGKEPSGDEERDWSVPVVDAFAHLQSPFHRWDPRIKIASLVVYSFMVAAFSGMLGSACALAVALVSVRVAGIPARVAARRIAAMVGFLAMFLVIMPLTVPFRPGDPAVLVGPWSSPVLNLRGFVLAVVIFLKAAAIALTMEVMLDTAPLPVTVRALSRIGVPRIACEMVLLAHRYIFVFLHEAKRMAMGMRVRGFQKKTGWTTLHTLGNFLGMLFVRSFERTQRVYDAMCARGYRGTFPLNERFQARPADWLKGVFWLSLGMGLYGIDRFRPLAGILFSHS